MITSPNVIQTFHHQEDTFLPLPLNHAWSGKEGHLCYLLSVRLTFVFYHLANQIVYLPYAWQSIVTINGSVPEHCNTRDNASQSQTWCLVIGLHQTEVGIVSIGSQLIPPLMMHIGKFPSAIQILCFQNYIFLYFSSFKMKFEGKKQKDSRTNKTIDIHIFYINLFIQIN